MPDLEVDANLQVEDGASERPLNVDDFSPDQIAAIQVAAEAIQAAMPSGFATQTTLASVLAKIIAAPATEAKQDSHTTRLEAIRDRLPSSLDTDGSLPVADVFTGGQALSDQSGAGAVLTFTFASAVDLIWVRSVGAVSRADPFGGTPSASAGIYCADDEPTPITVRATVVKVFAPSGAEVKVWGFRS